jgi:shikimate kinase
MPGSGKSTWGKKLANALKYSFIDLDEMIEKTTGMSIENIFEQKGEEYFREIEHKCLLETSVLSNVLVSTGGGCPCYFNNMEIMNNEGITIYINANKGILVDRILNAKKQRPLFFNLLKPEIEVKIDELLIKRKDYYSQAKYTFGVPQESVQTFVNKASQLILTYGF